MSAIYSSKKTRQVAQFVNRVIEDASVDAKGATFDSAASDTFVSELENRSGDAIPESVKAIFDACDGNNRPKDKNKVVRAIFDSVQEYKRQHGQLPTADVVEWALHQGKASVTDANGNVVFDDATSMHHDAGSLQPNRAIIAVVGAMSETIPVAGYLPADIRSNEAKAIILNHTAGSDFGEYANGDIMDGISQGGQFASASRIHKLTLNGANWEGQLTAQQTDFETCDPAGDVIKWLRRITIYINGYPCGFQASVDGTAATVAIVGSIKIGATTYTLTGTLTPASGLVSVTPSAALPNGTTVHAEGFIDYEANAGIIPLMFVSAEEFNYFAYSWKIRTEHTIEARTQMANEIGIDPMAETMIAVRHQLSNERHYQVLNKALRLGLNHAYSFDFNWAGQGLQKSRAEIWRDFFNHKVGQASQEMAENTRDHGITHMYVPKQIAAQWMSLPGDLFTPSGITGRPGIYRVGTLNSGIEVYYAPKVVSDSGATSRILAIGRSNQVARNPFMLGDAVAPTVKPINMNTDMVEGQAIYSRSFTEANKHKPSAEACAVIDIINQS